MLRTGTRTAAGSLDARQEAGGAHARPLEPPDRFPPGLECTRRRPRSQRSTRSALLFERADRPGTSRTRRGKPAHVEPKRMVRSPFHSSHDNLPREEREWPVCQAPVCLMESAEQTNTEGGRHPARDPRQVVRAPRPNLPKSAETKEPTHTSPAVQSRRGKLRVACEAEPGESNPKVQWRPGKYDKGGPSPGAEDPVDLSNDKIRRRDMGKNEDTGSRGEAPRSKREPLADRNDRTGDRAPSSRIDTDDGPALPLEYYEIFATTASDIEEPTAGGPEQLVGEGAISGTEVRMKVEYPRGPHRAVHHSPSPTRSSKAPAMAASTAQRMPTTSHSRNRPWRSRTCVMDSVRPSYRSRPLGSAEA